MEVWITQNWLALYGALVGSVALLINIFRFKFQLSKENIKLSVGYKAYQSEEDILKTFKDTEENSAGSAPNLLKAYKLNIKNTGLITAYIEDAGIICKDGWKHQALITQNSKYSFLSSISKAGKIELKPKSSQDVFVYCTRKETPFCAKSCYVEDATGKTVISKKIL